jgi:hypothetical protein
MTYLISYNLSDQGSNSSNKTTHTRCYKALSEATALSMFEETCSHGGLKGYQVELVQVEKIPKADSKLSGL